MQECRARGIVDDSKQPEVFCTAFEDNSGALEMARSPKIRPRTKHINLKYHHFREHIAQDGEDATGKIHVRAIDTRDQLADVFTKAGSYLGMVDHTHVIEESSEALGSAMRFDERFDERWRMWRVWQNIVLFVSEYGYGGFDVRCEGV
eukprot:scaffold22031_cov73-Cylindrotheca_fusiformis.AAC.1